MVFDYGPVCKRHRQQGKLDYLLFNHLLISNQLVFTQQSAGSTLENIKRDLSEFKDAVQTDATSMMYSTASIVKNKLNDIGNTVNEIGSLGTNEEDEGELNESKSEVVDEEAASKSSSKKASVADENEAEDESPFNLETINTWTNMLTDRAKSTISMVKETLVDSIFVNRDFMIDELNEEPYVIKDGQVVPIENWKELLHGLQINPDTYCREPSGPPEEFDLWLTKFNLINYQKQMEYLLDTVPEILKLHTNLVPKELSDSDFWHRYYYKVHQLRDVQKQLILQSTEVTSPMTSEPAASPATKPNTVNIKYLTEKSNDASRADSDSKISRSSTEDWEKMTDNEPIVDKSSRGSSDEDRDWVKYD